MKDPKSVPDPYLYVEGTVTCQLLDVQELRVMYSIRPVCGYHVDGLRRLYIVATNRPPR